MHFSEDFCFIWRRVTPKRLRSYIFYNTGQLNGNKNKYPKCTHCKFQLLTAPKTAAFSSKTAKLAALGSACVRVWHSHWLYVAIKLKILNIIVSEKLAPSCPQQLQGRRQEAGGWGPLPLTCAVALLGVRHKRFRLHSVDASYFYQRLPDNIADSAKPGPEPKAIYARSYSSLNVVRAMQR